MDASNLSDEAFSIIDSADDFCTFLKTELGVLASSCESEAVYLRKAHDHIEAILTDQEDFLEDWALEEALDESQLRALLKQIADVQSIPEDRRTYLGWSGK